MTEPPKPSSSSNVSHRNKRIRREEPEEPEEPALPASDKPFSFLPPDVIVSEILLNFLLDLTLIDSSRVFVCFGRFVRDPGRHAWEIFQAVGGLNRVTVANFVIPGKVKILVASLPESSGPGNYLEDEFRIVRLEKSLHTLKVDFRPEHHVYFQLLLESFAKKDRFPLLERLQLTVSFKDGPPAARHPFDRVHDSNLGRLKELSLRMWPAQCPRTTVIPVLLDHCVVPVDSLLKKIVDIKSRTVGLVVLDLSTCCCCPRKILSGIIKYSSTLRELGLWFPPEDDESLAGEAIEFPHLLKFHFAVGCVYDRDDAVSSAIKMARQIQLNWSFPKLKEMVLGGIGTFLVQYFCWGWRHLLSSLETLLIDDRERYICSSGRLVNPMQWVHQPDGMPLVWEKLKKLEIPVGVDLRQFFEECTFPQLEHLSSWKRSRGFEHQIHSLQGPCPTPELRLIDLQMAKISLFRGGSFEHLTFLRILRIESITDVDVTVFLSELRLPNLTVFECHGNDENAAVIEMVRKMSRLRELCLGTNDKVTAPIRDGIIAATVEEISVRGWRFLKSFFLTTEERRGCFFQRLSRLYLFDCEVECMIRKEEGESSIFVLPQLQFLVLQACRMDDGVFQRGFFPQLMKLVVEDCSDVWGTDWNSMPKLQDLRIRRTNSAEPKIQVCQLLVREDPDGRVLRFPDLRLLFLFGKIDIAPWSWWRVDDPSKIFSVKDALGWYGTSGVMKRFGTDSQILIDALGDLRPIVVERKFLEEGVAIEDVK